MTKNEKKRWVRNFVGSIQGDVLKAISSGKIPAEWGGRELSELLAIKFEGQSHVRGGVIRDSHERRRRARIRREVSNTYAVNNL